MLRAVCPNPAIRTDAIMGIPVACLGRLSGADVSFADRDAQYLDMFSPNPQRDVFEDP